MRQMNTTQQGFTLIELMIAMTLGLIIAAAAVGIYLANYRTLSTQKSSSEMQSASMFGIQPLEARLRLANLGNDDISITDTAREAGIVLTNNNATGITDDGLSATATGGSNTGTASDQLTIQFTNVTPFTMFNCEGAEIGRDVRSIERYFVREGTNGLVLACDAGRFVSGTLEDFGDDGVELVSGVDLFRFLLGTQSLDNSGNVVTRFYTVDDYMDDSEVPRPKPAIVSVKTGIIARGSTPISTSEGLSEFTLLGQNETLNADVNRQFVRNTFETTTLLRNARVISFQATGQSVKIN